MNKVVSRNRAIQEARELGGDGTNEEYVRGMTELIARCFPEDGIETEFTAKKIEGEILAWGVKV